MQEIPVARGRFPPLHTQAQNYIASDRARRSMGFASDNNLIYEAPGLGKELKYKQYISYSHSYTIYKLYGLWLATLMTNRNMLYVEQFDLISTPVFPT